MKLYEITGALLELLEMAEEKDLDQQTINDTMEAVELEFEEKADGYAKVIKTLDGNVDLLDKEINRLTERKKTVKSNIASIKKNLENAMIATGKRKFKTLLFNFGIQKNPAALIIDDESQIPQEYLVPQEPKVDKAAIKDYLKENEVEWAHLTQTESLRIK